MHSAVFAAGDTVVMLARASHAYHDQVIVVKQGRSAFDHQRFLFSSIRAPPPKETDPDSPVRIYVIGTSKDALHPGCALNL
ncbi:hypothetical protein [Ktedonospora formicarum]|uniref:Uncharacterized protein n=1 Tax=Ktedonospora formicarum TaxID=2778364 RepID=A0A8J3IF95_9CHLR|nr:hypothetical protein [Ktedonospora formicarum]GHO50854.1 hypothetical protein KSX_90170 [Ktedonospora formicarum]